MKVAVAGLAFLFLAFHSWAQAPPAAPGILLPLISRAAPAAAAQGQGADPQRPVSVLEDYKWEAYFGFTFVRFRALPGYSANRGGFNYSMVYCLNNRIAADGEFTWGRGSQRGVPSKFLLGLGGVRFRWDERLGVNLWLHGLGGRAQYTPQTPFGGQTAFGYELGGGADFNTHSRLALRVEGDMVGTRFFGASQYSPKISTGIVFQF